MRATPDTMRTGLRVLTAVTAKRDPDPADLDELRRFAPLLADAPVDALARDVIQTMKRRSEVRRALSRR
jgi:hypothetical protein